MIQKPLAHQLFFIPMCCPKDWFCSKLYLLLCTVHHLLNLIQYVSQNAAKKSKFYFLDIHIGTHETHIHFKVFHLQCELSVNILFIQYEMKSHLLSEYLVLSLSEFYLNNISIFSPLHYIKLGGGGNAALFVWLKPLFSDPKLDILC